MEGIFVLLPSQAFRSEKELVLHRQALYPSTWAYKPVGIEVEITNKCNIACAGCGQRDEIHRPDDILSAEDIVEVSKAHIQYNSTHQIS